MLDIQGGISSCPTEIIGDRSAYKDESSVCSPLGKTPKGTEVYLALFKQRTLNTSIYFFEMENSRGSFITYTDYFNGSKEDVFQMVDSVEIIPVEFLSNKISFR